MSKSKYVIIATLLLVRTGRGGSRGCVGHRRVAARYARARPLSKPPEGALSSRASVYG